MLKSVLKVLLIQYIFLNGKIGQIGSNGIGIKEFYERNSRGAVKIHLRTIHMRVPYNSVAQTNKVVTYVKRRLPKNHDVYVHFALPKVSRANGRHIVTHSTRANAIHEFGHTLGLSHANSRLRWNITKRGNDPFSQMTTGIPYFSMNPPHLYQLNWFLPGEITLHSTERQMGQNHIYTLHQLRDFHIGPVLKCVHIKIRSEVGAMRSHFLSYGKIDGQLYIALHVVYGEGHSFLLGKYPVERRTFSHRQIGLSFNVLSFNNSVVRLVVL